jgi:hypothetical protein
MAWDDDEDSTIPCPYCHEPVYEGSPRCPHCEQYISEEDAPPSRKPRWLIAGFVICLIIAALWILGR